MMKPSSCLLAAALSCALAGCTRHPEPFPPVAPGDSAETAIDNLAHREQVREFFLNDPGSPFRRDSSIVFTEIRWFPIDPRFRASSLLHRYAQAETVTVLGTRGEERRNLKYGYFEFLLPDSGGSAARCRLNVYKFTPSDTLRYALYKDELSVWFTDLTTGRETYEVGRYIEVGVEFPEADHRYILDFNKAYNPYCAYSTLYSCAVPRDEDHLALPVRAGEMKYHE
jgi:uncharacterized protein